MFALNVDCGYSLCGGSKLPFLQILKTLHNAWACLCNDICHFDEIIIISMKLKTVFVKRMHSLQEFCGADSIGV